jgi:hypothetical protein
MFVIYYLCMGVWGTAFVIPGAFCPDCKFHRRARAVLDLKGFCIGVDRGELFFPPFKYFYIHHKILILGGVTSTPYIDSTLTRLLCTDRVINVNDYDMSRLLV